MKKYFLILLLSFLSLSGLLADTPPNYSSDDDAIVIIDRRYGISAHFNAGMLNIFFNSDIGHIRCQVVDYDATEVYSATVDSSFGYYSIDLPNRPGHYILILRKGLDIITCVFIIS